MVRIEKEYVFGPGGRAGLIDLFEGRRQLIVGHFMFDPSWEEGCPELFGGVMRSRTDFSVIYTSVKPRSSTSPRAAGEDRGIQGEQGLDLCGTLPTAVTSTTISTQLWTSPSHPSSTTSKP